MMLEIANAILAGADGVSPIGQGLYYQYVVAADGLYLRAEDSRLAASVKIADAACPGAGPFQSFAGLKVERVPGVWLRSILASARRHMPNEILYQFHFGGETHKAVTHTWRCSSPAQTTTPTGIKFEDDGLAVIDLHSHNSMPAFFSSTDDADEQGLRFYAVIGRVETDVPEIRVRVGVYGHHLDVPADMIFDDLGPFIDRSGEPIGSTRDPHDDEIESATDGIMRLGLDEELRRDPDYVAGPMWGCALLAKDKRGDPQLLVEMIAATDQKDALAAAMDEAKSTWPEYQGYNGHDVAVIYAHD